MSGFHRHEFIVPESALDANGHVNNVEYVRWMQEAALRHADHVGCTRDTQAADATWVARSHWIEYLRPGYAGDRLIVLTWVATFSKARSLRKYRFVRLPDEVVLACGETDWVYVDAARGRPRAIPARLKAMFRIPPEDPDALAAALKA